MKLAAGKEPLIKVIVSRRTHLAIGIAIFLLAFGVRVLSWHDTRPEVGKVQAVVVGDYKRVAQLLRQGGVSGFFSPSSPLADPNNLGHPPGYSILIALTHSVFGDSDSAVQFVQIFFDSLAAVIIFLIVAELFSTFPALIAGLLAAFSPQLAWNSVLLLPDSLAVFPILLSVYLLARGRKKPQLALFVAAGALVGISCWLRANSMLLTFFLAAAVPLLITRKGWLRYSLAVVFATVLVVLPLTLRNAIVYKRFIPLSLGAGQTLLEGIADYDSARRFNIPNTDMGIMKQEAELANRPEYYGTLFNPDGVERERWRLRRGFAVIRSHPIWFSGVMIRRAGSMLRLERARLMSINPPVSHSIDAISNSTPTWRATPYELVNGGVVLSPQAKPSVVFGSQTLDLIGDDSRYGKQFATPPVPVRGSTDYVFTAAITTESGRMKLSVTGENGKVFASSIVERAEVKEGDSQPATSIHLPFVASRDEQVRIQFANEAPDPPKPLVKIGTVSLHELGRARLLWTRYPRLLIRGVQGLFLTAIILPLAIIGLLFAVFRKQSAALVVLSVVPLYYFCVQSAFHTEYRYVLAVNYFLFAFAAAGIVWIVTFVKTKFQSLRPVPSRSTH